MLDPRVAAWANMAFGVDLTAAALIRRDNVTTKASKALELILSVCRQIHLKTFVQ